MQFRATLIAGGESSVTAVQPGEGPLHDPAVPSEALFRFDAASCDSWNDSTHVAARAAEDLVVRLVCVQLRGAESRPAASAERARRFRIRYR